MKELAPGVHQLAGFPPNSVNVYLVGDVLVDAGSRLDRHLILRQLKGRRLGAHVLTHAHPDHQGASRAVCTTFGIPFWVHEEDVAPAEDPRIIEQRQPDTIQAKVSQKLFAGPGHPVDRALREGDEVAGFQVLHVPGHSAGHIALWRESDRVLIVGDVVNTWHPLFMIPGVRQPPDYWTPDPARNRESIRRLGRLEPRVVAAGHGPPLRDGRPFSEFAARL
jgi:hydroxyacylglutathione hydrolase